MNIKELIFSLPALDIAEAYVTKYDDLDPEKKIRAVDQVAAFISTLKDREPKDTGHLILGISFVDDDEDEDRHEFLDACLFKKDDLAAQFDWDSPLAKVTTLEGLTDDQVEELAHTRFLPDSYAYEYSLWDEILGFEVDPYNLLMMGPIPMAANVLWEMTFFGFEESQVDAEREELHRRADELDEILKLPKEEQEKHFVPAEKVFAKLGLPERTEEEKAADHRRMSREIAENGLRKYRAMREYLERQKGE